MNTIEQNRSAARILAMKDDQVRNPSFFDSKNFDKYAVITKVHSKGFSQYDYCKENEVSKHSDWKVVRKGLSWKCARNFIEKETGHKYFDDNNCFDSLSQLKEMLFDAPVDIKQGFNNIVQYFDNSKSGNYYIIEQMVNDLGESNYYVYSKEDIDSELNRLNNKKYKTNKDKYNITCLEHPFDGPYKSKSDAETKIYK